MSPPCTMTATTPTKAKTRPVSATVMAKASSVNRRKVTSSPENQKITKKLITTATPIPGRRETCRMAWVSRMRRWPPHLAAAFRGQRLGQGDQRQHEVDRPKAPRR